MIPLFDIWNIFFNRSWKASNVWWLWGPETLDGKHIPPTSTTMVIPVVFDSQIYSCEIKTTRQLK